MCYLLTDFIDSFLKTHIIDSPGWMSHQGIGDKKRAVGGSSKLTNSLYQKGRKNNGIFLRNYRQLILMGIDDTDDRWLYCPDVLQGERQWMSC